MVNWTIMEELCDSPQDTFYFGSG